MDNPFCMPTNDNPFQVPQPGEKESHAAEEAPEVAKEKQLAQRGENQAMYNYSQKVCGTREPRFVLLSPAAGPTAAALQLTLHAPRALLCCVACLTQFIEQKERELME